MKIHLINYQNTQETQPIDLENIFSIGLVTTKINPNHHTKSYIWHYAFAIIPKIGQALSIYSGLDFPDFTPIDSPISLGAKEFLTRERDRLIAAWEDLSEKSSPSGTSTFKEV